MSEDESNKISRRRMLRYGLAGAAAIAVPVALWRPPAADASPSMPIPTHSTAAFNEAVKANPEILNNRTIYRANLSSSFTPNTFDSVILENMVIRDLTLRDVQMLGAQLKNVTFVDCAFIKTNFNDSVFSNVKFIRGCLSGYIRPDSYDDYLTSFRGVDIDRVLFDGVYLDNSVAIDFYDGIVVMKNITTRKESDKVASVLSGHNLHVRMDNCKVFNRGCLNVTGENSSAYITNSHFENTTPVDDMQRGQFSPHIRIGGTSAWIENCILNGLLPGANNIVIKDCTIISASVSGGAGDTKAFLVNNRYTPKPGAGSLRVFITQDIIHDSWHCYLYGSTSIFDAMYIDTGNVHIFDMEIDKLILWHQRAKTALPNLDLVNVKIKSGNWKYADVRQGKWENVEIYPPVNLANAKFGEIIGHHVEFPKGTPWVNGKLNITNSPEPLEFDRPPVPTLEELGLAQFWRENDFPDEKY